MCTGRRGGGRAIARREAEAPERERGRGHLRLRAAPPGSCPALSNRLSLQSGGRDHALGLHWRMGTQGQGPELS